MLKRLIVPLASLMLSVASVPAAAKSKKPVPEVKGTPAASALDAAKRDWQALKTDSRRSKYRSHWLKIAAEFGSVVKRFPGTPEAAKALYDAGELYEELSRVSWIQEDVDNALAAYQKLAKVFPQSPLADDAHLAAARIFLARKNDADHARAELKAIIKGYPKGDMLGQARTMLAQLPKDDDAPAKVASAPKERPAAREKLAVVSKEPASALKEPAPKVEKAAAPVVASKEKGEKGPQVKVVDAEWAEAKGDSAPATPAPPIVDAAAIDGTPAEAALDADDDGAPATVSTPKPLEPVEALKGANKDRLAALASAVRGSDELPLSAQFGLKIRRVVIDAGHGGHDTGAIGPSGAKEKDVTLAIARKLAEKLRAQGLEVFLTRGEDRFVSLENRAAFANEKHADLFISVHCNAAAQHNLHGVETYSLNISSDRFAMRLAARENASSEKSIGDLQFLLADVATRANTVDSRRLAGMVQSSVVGGLRTRYGQVRDLGTKEALFYVLLGTRMPAILVEGSFISNPDEEKRLTDPEFQDQLATSISGGVERFVSDHQALATAGLP